MLDEDIDTAQAMADLDVIFASDRLDAILGSTQQMPQEDASLGTMLGLEVLEDLAHAYPSDTDFQQALDGCGIDCCTCMQEAVLILSHTLIESQAFVVAQQSVLSQELGILH